MLSYLIFNLYGFFTHLKYLTNYTYYSFEIIKPEKLSKKRKVSWMLSVPDNFFVGTLDGCGLRRRILKLLIQTLKIPDDCILFCSWKEIPGPQDHLGHYIACINNILSGHGW